MARRTTYAAAMQDPKFLQLQKQAQDEYEKSEIASKKALEHARLCGFKVDIV